MFNYFRTLVAEHAVIILALQTRHYGSLSDLLVLLNLLSSIFGQLACRFCVQVVRMRPQNSHAEVAHKGRDSAMSHVMDVVGTAGSHLRRKATRVPGAMHEALLSRLKHGDTVCNFGLLDTLAYVRRI
jgi:hypothetical protein